MYGPRKISQKKPRFPTNNSRITQTSNGRFDQIDDGVLAHSEMLKLNFQARSPETSLKKKVESGYNSLATLPNRPRLDPRRIFPGSFFLSATLLL